MTTCESLVDFPLTVNVTSLGPWLTFRSAVYRWVITIRASLLMSHKRAGKISVVPHVRINGARIRRLYMPSEAITPQSVTVA
jgi:hypothetical protein